MYCVKCCAAENWTNKCFKKIPSANVTREVKIDWRAKQVLFIFQSAAKNTLLSQFLLRRWKGDKFALASVWAASSLKMELRKVCRRRLFASFCFAVGVCFVFFSQHHSDEVSATYPMTTTRRVTMSWKMELCGCERLVVLLTEHHHP